MIVCGCDLGSTTAKAVIMEGDDILSWSIVKATRTPELTARMVIDEALGNAGLKSFEMIKYIVGTGYGRTGVSFLHDNMSEITCHAFGAYWLHPKVKTVVDIGGQDCKVISLDPRGKVLEFNMNDKCAAGTGRFFESMAKVLDCTLDELARFALESTKSVNISKQCSVFAESEVISLINCGVSIQDIAAGIHDSIARRILGMVNRIGIYQDVVLTGGCAQNRALIKSLEKHLGVIIVETSENPQITGALGAALYARDNAAKNIKTGE